MCWIYGCALLFQELKNLKCLFKQIARQHGSLLLRLTGFSYFSGICDVFVSDPIVDYFSGPFRVIIIQTPFYYFQKPAFLASIIVATFTNVN